MTNDKQYTVEFHFPNALVRTDAIDFESASHYMNQATGTRRFKVYYGSVKDRVVLINPAQLCYVDVKEVLPF